MLPFSGFKFLRRIDSSYFELARIFFIKNQEGYDSLRDADLSGIIVIYFYCDLRTVHLVHLVILIKKVVILSSKVVILISKVVILINKVVILISKLLS
jgi:hypothetical protein